MGKNISDSTTTIDRNMGFAILRVMLGINILIYGLAVSFLLFNTKYDHLGIDRGFSFKK